MTEGRHIKYSKEKSCVDIRTYVCMYGYGIGNIYAIGYYACKHFQMDGFRICTKI